MSSVLAALVGAYELAAAVGILWWWARAWRRGERLATADVSTHVAAEAIAAVMLIVGAAGEFYYGGAQLTSIVAMGMLIYASVNSAGGVSTKSRKVAYGMVCEAAVTAVVLLVLVSLS